MPRDENYLAAKVACVNQTNDYANKLYSILVDAIRPFVGKKVVKQTGELTEALKKAIPELPSNTKLHVYCSTYRTYSLSWEVKSSYVTGEWGCDYYSASVSVGRIDNHVLVGIVPTCPEYRTDITVEEIQQKREKYEQLKKEADAAKNEIPYQFCN